MLAIVAALACLTTPALAQTPAYTPPPTWDDPEAKNPGPGQADTFICADWLMKHAARLNEAKGPGGRNPVTKIYGPAATRGSFGSNDVGCFLTLRHQDGTLEVGWLVLNPALRWMPEK